MNLNIYVVNNLRTPLYNYVFMGEKGLHITCERSEVERGDPSRKVWTNMERRDQ